MLIHVITAGAAPSIIFHSNSAISQFRKSNHHINIYQILSNIIKPMKYQLSLEEYLFVLREIWFVQKTLSMVHKDSPGFP